MKSKPLKYQIRSKSEPWMAIIRNMRSLWKLNQAILIKMSELANYNFRLLDFDWLASTSGCGLTSTNIRVNFSTQMTFIFFCWIGKQNFLLQNHILWLEYLIYFHLFWVIDFFGLSLMSPFFKDCPVRGLGEPGRTWDLLGFSFIFSQLQYLRPLGYCALL